MRRKREVCKDGLLIKAELLKQNITEKELAEKLGYSPVNISNFIHGKNRSKTTKMAIFNELGLYEKIRA